MVGCTIISIFDHYWLLGLESAVLLTPICRIVVDGVKKFLLINVP